MATNNIIASGEGSQAAGRDINNFITKNSSFIFDPQDLADLIDNIFANIEEEDNEPIYDFSSINIDEKNQKNNVTEEFYENCIKEEIGYFSKIEKFLKNPKHKKYSDKFFGIVKVLKPKVLNAMQNGKSMQDILPILFDYFFETNQNCDDDKKPMIIVLAYYMYHNCYIGRK